MTARRARPRLHFTAAAGWINDPLGLTHHDGRYHLFFQTVPGRTTWATGQHWGHATSDDLLHWTDRGVVLSPGDGDDGVWSGSVAVPDDGPAALFYTSAREPHTHLAGARVARPDDPSWASWTKGPLVAAPPAGLDLVAVRDPYVTHDGTSWLMLLGAGLADGTATALAYRSADLATWTYDGPLAERHRSLTDPWTGDVWECPQLFRCGDRWVLVVSAWSVQGPGHEAYAVGDLVGGRFVAEAWHRLSHGPSLYAAAHFTDAAGAPGLIHWVRGVADPAGRWAGAHSLPHGVELDDLAGDRLVVRPHDAVAAARDGGTVTGGGRATVPVPPAVDLEWSLDGPGAPASLVLDGGDGEGGGEGGGDGDARLGLETAGDRLVARVGAAVAAMPLRGRRVRVVVDGPVVEVFAGDGAMALAVPGLAAARCRLDGSGAVVAHPLV